MPLPSEYLINFLPDNMYLAIPKIFTFRNYARLLAAAAIFVAGVQPAQAQVPMEMAIEEAGQPRSVELATDEIEVARKGEQAKGSLRQLVETKVAGASVVDDTVGHVVVKLPRPYDMSLAVLRSEKIDLAVPDAEMAPVFYLKGAPKDKWNRRLASKSVLVYLKNGETPEQARQAAGAAGIRETGIQGVTVLKFLTPFQAIESTRKLTSRGIQNRPLLRQYLQKMGTPPQDQYFQEQWHLVNTGQRNGVAGVDINVLPAWDIGLANGVTISIVDDCLQTTHPDLRENCPPVSTKLHHDFRDGDDDPKPTDPEDGHGTAVAGLAGARQNNGAPDPTTGLLLGVSGVAPEARLLGLRLIGGPTSDEDTADALTWGPNNAVVDVCNNSWGFTGTSLVGFDLLSKAAQRDAAVKGREGKGQVTVFAAGNGRANEANANYSSASNSRYVVTVGAINSVGTRSSYSTPGAPLLVCAPGGGFGFFGADQRCVTTDVTGVGGFNPAAGDITNTDYTRQMNGTSSATPITSGVVALMLGANPNLSWRDVKEILAGTSRRIDETDPGWLIRPAETGAARFYNGSGFKFNDDYGSGLVDAFGAVVRSQTWKNLGPEISQSRAIKEATAGANIPDDGQAKLTRDFDFSGAAFPNLRLEQIEVEIQITHNHRSDLEIAVISPSGVRSILANKRFRPQGGSDTDKDYRDIVIDAVTGVLTPRSGGWVFSTTHHWGENSTGKWTIEVIDRVPGTSGKLLSSAIRLYGTESGQQRVMFDQQLYTVVEPGNPVSGTFTQTGSAMTVNAGGHSLAVGSPVYLTFSDGAPNSIPNNIYSVVTSIPGTSFTITAPDSVARTGNVAVKPALNQAITVRRLGGTSGAFSVDYQTATGTATPGQDYLVTTGTLSFANGDTTKDILIPILADSEPEVTESVQVILKNLQGAQVAFGGNTLARISVVDDEVNFIKVEATDGEASERSSEVAADPGVFTITRSKVSSQPQDVFFTLGGSATPGTGPGGDYNPLPGNGGIFIATIPSFQTSVDVIIQPREDTGVIEGTENVILTLLPSSAYQVGVPASAEVIIIDNDRPKVQMTLLDNLADEKPPISAADSASFLIRRSVADGKSLIVSLEYGGTQILGVNYFLKYTGPDGSERTLSDPLVSKTVEIAPNQTDVVVTLVPIDDNIYQATKTVDISIQPRPDYDFNFGFLTSVHLNIVERDPFPDTRIPVVAITAPAARANFDAPASVNFEGRAGDNESVSRVLYRINRGDWQIVPSLVAGPRVTWSVPIVYVSQSGVLVSGSSEITGLADTSKVAIGMPVEGAGIPTGAAIVSIGAQGSGKITIDKLATQGATTTIRVSYLGLGANVIETMSIDNDGNPSRIASSQFDYVQMRLLTVNVNGPGTVTRGFIPTSSKEAGQVVRISAMATPGSVFNGWTGFVSTPQRTIGFVMPNADATLTANFIASPFVREITGIYSGLIEAPALSSFAFETSGFIRLNVTTTGAFTGQFALGGVSYPLVGEFSGSGQYVAELRRINNFSLTLNLTLDVSPSGTKRIVGTISTNTAVSTVIANRAAYSSSNPVPANLIGRYTLLLPSANPIGDAQRDPRGNGIGTLALGSTGMVYWRGTLADGTKVSQSQPLSKDNSWPVFLNLYKSKGVMLGNVSMDRTQTTTDLSGKFDWSKPVVAGDRYFPLGFRIVNSEFLGSFYEAPAAGTSALPTFGSSPDNGRLTLQEGSLLNDITKTMTYSAANRISLTNPGRERVVLVVDAKSGSVSGSFVHPVSSRKTELSGVIFKKKNIIVGRFQGSSIAGVNPQTGRLLIEQSAQ